MKIKDLNYWPCVWFREDRLFTREDLLNHKDAEFFAFWNPYDSCFRLALRSDIADVFLRENLVEIDPLEDLPFWDNIPINAE
ncbi:MAG: hypothetical protein IIY02_03535, partial [Firmicutes bacterium]|nr:hypothetical protein [Bacillota bacterium]